MQVKERGWSAPLNNDTAEYEQVNFTNEGHSNATQLSDGKIKTLANGWSSGGNSVEEFTGDCKAVWVYETSANQNTMVGLSYQDYSGWYTSIDYKVSYTYSNTSKYYVTGPGLSGYTVVQPQVGDKVTVERKNGRIYFYVIRTDGSRIDLTDLAETSIGSPMKMAYTSWQTNVILDVRFYELVHPKGFGYRFAFQGQEGDDEVSGKGNSIAFKYRIHDPRLGRFFSTDPLQSVLVWNSPYSFCENNVFAYIEFEGLQQYGVPNNNAQSRKVFYRNTNSTRLRTSTTNEIRRSNSNNREIINRQNPDIAESPVIDNAPHSGGQSTRGNNPIEIPSVSIMLKSKDATKIIKTLIIGADEIAVKEETNSLYHTSYKNAVFVDKNNPKLNELQNLEDQYNTALNDYISKHVVKPSHPTNEEMETDPKAISKYLLELSGYAAAKSMAESTYQADHGLSPKTQFQNKVSKLVAKMADNDETEVTKNSEVVETVYHDKKR